VSLVIAGLIKGKTIAIDATTLEANAAHDQIMLPEALEQLQAVERRHRRQGKEGGGGTRHRQCLSQQANRARCTVPWDDSAPTPVNRGRGRQHWIDQQAERDAMLTCTTRAGCAELVCANTATALAICFTLWVFLRDRLTAHCRRALLRSKAVRDPFSPTRADAIFHVKNGLLPRAVRRAIGIGSFAREPSWRSPTFCVCTAPRSIC
jgi:hypothetical protein